MSLSEIVDRSWRWRDGEIEARLAKVSAIAGSERRTARSMAAVPFPPTASFRDGGRTAVVPPPPAIWSLTL
ncbi:hypothetical protein MSIM_33500 [Mycobacterium simiae]|nr:hypothetical protein MSIM_33500 [Mycobacterium simiae]